MEAPCLVGEDELLDARPPRRGRWAIAVVVCAALVAVGAAGERFAVEAGAQQLADASVQIEAQARVGTGEIVGVVAYAGPSLTSGGVPAVVRDDLVLLVRGAADRTAADVAALVPAPPLAARWNTGLRADQELLARRAQALADELRRTGLQYRLSSESDRAPSA